MDSFPYRVIENQSSDTSARALRFAASTLSQAQLHHNRTPTARKRCPFIFIKQSFVWTFNPSEAPSQLPFINLENACC